MTQTARQNARCYSRNMLGLITQGN